MPILKTRKSPSVLEGEFDSVLEITKSLSSPVNREVKSNGSNLHGILIPWSLLLK